MRACWVWFVACGIVFSSVSLIVAGENQPIDYLKQIKPIIEARCVSCHGPQKQKSGLRLDAIQGFLDGGDSGPAVVPGKSGESLLYQAVSRAEGVSPMPPIGQPSLQPAEIALLKAWIDQGAKAASQKEKLGPRVRVAPVEKIRHWSFQPILRPLVPAVKKSDWVHNPIDAFVLSRLESRGIVPSLEADKRTLIRRVSLDLTGLPPASAEVDAFLADTGSDAYEKVVTRLLASPHYGERWGRVWLDQARYADSNGFTRDFSRTIWKYRDWVIDAHNRDLPFDQMTREQLAGDLLPHPTTEQRIATGFHRNTLLNEEGGSDQEQFRVEAVVDRVGTTGVVFLGLTLGCAQCHAHKYDPITQRDFYQFYAFFNNADEPLLDLPTAKQKQAGEVEKRDRLRQEIAELEKQLAKQQDLIKAKTHSWIGRLTADDKKKLPANVLNSLNFSEEMRSDEDRKTLVEYYKSLPEASKEFPLIAQIASRRKAEPTFLTTLVMQERAEPRATHIHIRGDFLRHGAKVVAAVPASLPSLKSARPQANRLDLADWLTSLENPLTARVTVNRIWQKYFGRGIVETENDFGKQGAPPTHPELLDWLASEFRQPQEKGPGIQPWSLKTLHRLIVTSATYRQSSVHRPELAEIDPLNKLYARQSRLRLDAELIRDSGLAVSGLLSRKIGGPSVHPPQPDGVFDFTQDKKPWNTAVGPDRYRRGMYTYLWRSSPYPAMTVFDFPDSNVTCTRRSRSNTPLQSLTLANDEAFVEMAQGLAARVLREMSEQPKLEPRLQHAFQLCLSREPQPAELQRLQKLFRSQYAAFGDNLKAAEKLTPPLFNLSTNVQEFAAWTALSRVLLNLDEFVTRE